MKKVLCPVCKQEIDIDNGKEAYDHMQIDKAHRAYYLKCRREVIMNKFKQIIPMGAT